MGRLEEIKANHREFLSNFYEFLPKGEEITKFSDTAWLIEQLEKARLAMERAVSLIDDHGNDDGAIASEHLLAREALKFWLKGNGGDHG